MPAHLKLSKEHGYVLITAASLAFEIILTGFILVGINRSKAFSEEYLEDNYGDEHKRATGFTIPKGGFPDMGTGRYSQRLSYGKWLALNQAQRVHYNFIEQIVPILVFVILGGLEFPILATIFGGLYFIGRIFFCFYVSKKGSAHPMRIAGAGICDVALLGSFIVAIISGIEIMID